MRPREALSRLDRAQKSLAFKVIASIIIVALAITGFSAYAVAVKAPVDVIGAQQPAGGATTPAPAGAAPSSSPAPAADQSNPRAAAPQPTAEDKSAFEATERMYRDLLHRRADLTNVGIGTVVVAGIALTIVWLGLALTYLGLFAVAGLLVLPMWLVSRTAYAGRLALGEEASLAETLSAAIHLILGCTVLTAAFTALIQALRLALSGSHPILAVARNMIAEAVRMKISLVFIIILIFALAALPGTLSQDTPLRYRVQAFLQYGTGGSYWIIAILVLFFSAASVSFEQRDRQIWQTMTKPVSAWQYIMGKWLGACGLAAVLLMVCCAGVFLFTEYLRQQPAVGEDKQAIAAGTQGLTEDRFVLETQVLAARESVPPTLPFARDDKFEANLNQYIEENRRHDPTFAQDQATYNRVVDESWKGTVLRYFSIEPGQFEVYHFQGLSEAKRLNQPVTLRYRVEGGGNAPDQLYKITFAFAGVIHEPEEVTLGPTHTTSLLPSVIDDNGNVELAVYNAGLYRDPNTGEPVQVPNAGSISFPTGGLEISYSAGSYRMNFVRIAFILWIKLAFLAILAIAAATFLSFPVACLVAFSVFLIAEGSGFLATALEYYDATSGGDKIAYWKIPVRALGLAISGMFKTYADLRPTTKLVDGRLLAWSSVAWGTAVLTVWCLALYAAAAGIFRKRELATYSGQ